MNPIISFAAVRILFFDTLYKEYRSKTFLTLLFLTFAVILMSSSLLYMSINYFLDDAFSNQQVVEWSMNLFFNFIHLWSVFIAAILGANCVRSDFQNNVLTQLISFPITRFDYLLSRLLGSWVLVTLYYLVSIIITSIIFSIITKTYLFEANLLLALFNNSLITLVTLAIAMGYSLFFPRIFAVILTLISSALISTANAAVTSANIQEYLADFGVIQFFLLMIHWLFPRLAVIGQKTHIILNTPSDFALTEYLLALSHFFLSFAVLLYLINLMFKRKDF